MLGKYKTKEENKNIVGKQEHTLLTDREQDKEEKMNKLTLPVAKDRIQ